MRVLFVHNAYRHKGGEDTVVERERTLLAYHGHDVGLHSVSSHAMRGTLAALRTAWNLPYSCSSRCQLADVIREFQPDIVHVHNVFPLLTPSVYDACRDAGTPVVQTLHNYRMICAAGLLMREGKPCEDCIGSSPYQAVLHKCYGGSRLASLAVARMIDAHRRWGTWHQKVDHYIALTEFERQRFLSAGFPADRITVKPHFAPDIQHVSNLTERRGALYVGRLSTEKGVNTLLEAWQSVSVPLLIVGDGPLSDYVRRSCSNIIHWRGQLPPEAVVQAMESAAFLVMPSQCYETFGIVLVEAFACGLPVIASRLGAMAEIIEDGSTGLLFNSGDARDLAAKIRWIGSHPGAMKDMGQRARLTYERKYSPGVNYQQLVTIYKTAERSRPPG